MKMLKQKVYLNTVFHTEQKEINGVTSEKHAFCSLIALI
jgi:hypothetical protein